MPGIVALNIMCCVCCCCYVLLLLCVVVISSDVICVISILSCVRVCECVNKTECNVRNCSERVRRAESLSNCNNHFRNDALLLTLILKGQRSKRSAARSNRKKKQQATRANSHFQFLDLCQEWNNSYFSHVM